MAYLPKKSAIALISPIFCLLVGCSNTPKVTAPQAPVPVPPTPVAVDYTQDLRWIAAQATMDEEFKHAQDLQSWAAKMAPRTVTHLKAAKAKIKGQKMSECDYVIKLVAENKMEQIYGLYMDAYNIQAQMNPNFSASLQKVDLMIESAKANLEIAAINCKRAPK